jgi:hypothetical protein
MLSIAALPWQAKAAAVTPVVVVDGTAIAQPAFRQALLELDRQGSDRQAHGRLDAASLDRFKALIRHYGWPTVVATGSDGVEAAGRLLVRSSADYDFQNACVDALFKRVDIDVNDRAVLTINDHVEVDHGQPQQADMLFAVEQGRIALPSPATSLVQANSFRDTYDQPTVAEDMRRLQARLDHGASVQTLFAPPPLATATRSIHDPSLRDELAAMAGRDQAARDAFIQSGMKHHSPEAQAVLDVDKANLARLKSIFAAHGFPDRTLVGRAGVSDAWLLVQHAVGDKAFMAQSLTLARPLMLKGDLSCGNYALLVDRVNLQQDKPQVYGSQLQGQPGHFVVQPLEDPAHVDRRRTDMGMEPLADYIRRANAFYTPKTSAAAPATPR